MTDPLSDRSVSLPPIPDKTGTPRPPRAPRVDIHRREHYQVTSRHYSHEDQIGLWVSGEGATSDKERERARADPILEQVTAVSPPRDKVWDGLKLARNLLLFCGVPALLVALLQDFGWVVDNAAIIAAAVAAFFALVFVLSQIGGNGQQTWSAAAHVLDAGIYKVWLYELTGTTIRESRKGPMLRLAGKFGQLQGTVAIPLEVLEANQPMWDLVYNGIRHSAAAGAQVDPRTRELLRLPPPSNTPDAT